jgi:hypothetical protein
MIEIADVRRPVLAASGGLEGHRLGVARHALGLGQAVELAVEGQDAPTGGWRQEDPQPLEGRVDRELAEPSANMCQACRGEACSDWTQFVHAPLALSQPCVGRQQLQAPLPEQQTKFPAWQDGHDPPTAGQQTQAPPGLQVTQMEFGPQQAGVDP